MKDTNLLNDIQKKYQVKKGYQNKHKSSQKIIASKYDFKKANEYIDFRVDNLYLDISKKYKLEESDVYDKLYLKVRKLFLEMM